MTTVTKRISALPEISKTNRISGIAEISKTNRVTIPGDIAALPGRIGGNPWGSTWGNTWASTWAISFPGVAGIPGLITENTTQRVGFAGIEDSTQRVGGDGQAADIIITRRNPPVLPDPSVAIPNGAIAHIDFVNEEYSFNGEVSTLSDLVALDPSMPVVADRGIKIIKNPDPFFVDFPHASTSLLTALNSEIASSGGFTAYVEWETTTAFCDSLIIQFGNNPLVDGGFTKAISWYDGAVQGVMEDGGDTFPDIYSLFTETDASPQSKVNVGINKIAGSFGWDNGVNRSYAQSLNGDNPAHDSNAGQDTDTLSLSAMGPIEGMWLGGTWYWLPCGGGVFFTWLRQVTFFPPVAPADVIFISNNGALP